MSNLKTGKIGVFDSGLGGLVILRSIQAKLPQYDYVFYGDTKNLPYGNKTQREIFKLTTKAIEYLINEGCILIIIACNTASAKALRKIQQLWLPKNAPYVKILGVVIPTIEALSRKDFPSILMATESTVKSKVYERELSKIFPDKTLIGLPAPKLVPMIEQGNLKEATKTAEKYLHNLATITRSLVLGCTHYPLLKSELHRMYPKLKIVDQTGIIPKSLKKYLTKHKEITNKLSHLGTVVTKFSKITRTNQKLAKAWFK